MTISSNDLRTVVTAELVCADPADLLGGANAYPAAGIVHGLRGGVCSTFGFPVGRDMASLPQTDADLSGAER